jgi:hypothetical protein
VGRRVNETIYRVSWRREKWTCQRSRVFLSRRKAEDWRDRIVNAWPDGPNPLTYIRIDSARVTWEQYLWKAFEPD